jgi:hypothetical protein
MPADSMSLRVCLLCGSSFMSLEDWERTGGAWRLLLRCAECQVWRAVVVGKGQAQALEDELDAEVESIAAELARLESERMASEAEVLAIALERDLIDAGDFSR